jgi:hypothetical protein
MPPQTPHGGNPAVYGQGCLPLADLPTVAQNSPLGTTFCLHDGTYKISSPVIVQSGDVFSEVYSDSSKPHVTTDTAHRIFDAMAPWAPG